MAKKIGITFTPGFNKNVINIYFVMLDSGQAIQDIFLIRKYSCKIILQNGLKNFLKTFVISIFLKVAKSMKLEVKDN